MKITDFTESCFITDVFYLNSDKEQLYYQLTLFLLVHFPIICLINHERCAVRFSMEDLEKRSQTFVHNCFASSCLAILILSYFVIYNLLYSPQNTEGNENKTGHACCPLLAQND